MVFVNITIQYFLRVLYGVILSLFILQTQAISAINLNAFDALSSSKVIRLHKGMQDCFDRLLKNTAKNIDVDKLKALMESGFGDVLEAAVDNADHLNKIIARMDMPHFNGDLLNEMVVRFRKYADLKADLKTNPAWFETFDDVLKDPGLYWDIMKNTEIPKNTALNSWANGIWFKEVIAKGKIFESFVTNNLSTIARFKTFLNDGFIQLKQIYLKGTDMIIADDLLIKADVDDFGDKIYKAIINDSKLSGKSPWTPNQKSELINKFKNNSDLEYIDFEVRTKYQYLVEQGAPDDFVQGIQLRIYREDVYKTISNGNNNVSEVIKMTDINFQ